MVGRGLDKARACEVSYWLYSTIMTWPDDEAADLLRALMTPAEGE
jgi:hypothetical protein